MLPNIFCNYTERECTDYFQALHGLGKTPRNEILIAEKMVVARVAGVTAGLAESNGSLQPGL